MAAGALWQQRDAGNDEDADCRRGEWAAQGEAAVASRLIQEIADGGAEWPRQDEGGPEQKHARQIGAEIRRRENGKGGGEEDRTAVVA
jgi:hypothetical protein